MPVRGVSGTPNGPGYTGHVSDPDTGFVYMQARYYDPSVGRFLAVDPVAPYNKPMEIFNRYRYAANNPYKFIDPDGRQDCMSCERSYGAAVGYMLRDNPNALSTWQTGEQAATTTSGAALDGAELGQTVGEFVDRGDFSSAAVAGAVVKGMAAAITKGKSGHYTIRFKSGVKYHGKGSAARMNKSATERSKANDDPVEDMQHTSTENSREAFKGEARAIEADGGPGEGNYNKINSPGKKYLEQDRLKE